MRRRRLQKSLCGPDIDHPYAEAIRETDREMAERFDWALPEARATFLAESLPSRRPCHSRFR